MPENALVKPIEDCGKTEVLRVYNVTEQPIDTLGSALLSASNLCRNQCGGNCPHSTETALLSMTKVGGAPTLQGGALTEPRPKLLELAGSEEGEKTEAVIEAETFVDSVISNATNDDGEVDQVVSVGREIQKVLTEHTERYQTHADRGLSYSVEFLEGVAAKIERSPDTITDAHVRRELHTEATALAEISQKIYGDPETVSYLNRESVLVLHEMFSFGRPLWRSRNWKKPWKSANARLPVNMSVPANETNGLNISLRVIDHIDTSVGPAESGSFDIYTYSDREFTVAPVLDPYSGSDDPDRPIKRIDDSLVPAYSHRIGVACSEVTNGRKKTIALFEHDEMDQWHPSIADEYHLLVRAQLKTFMGRVAANQVLLERAPKELARTIEFMKLFGDRPKQFI